MSDAIMLGAIALALAIYNLYLQWKWNKLMHSMQLMLLGIYEGYVKVEEIKIHGKKRYIPVPK